MERNHCTAEEIISHVWTVKVETDKELGVVDACRKLGVTEQTHYRKVAALGSGDLPKKPQGS
jgi:hypothetical protein